MTLTSEEHMEHVRYVGTHGFAGRWLAVAALSVFLMTGMFYVGPSGLPQPADFLFVAVAAFLVWPAMGQNIANGNHAVAALAIWVIVVNGVWYIVIGDESFIRSAFIYVFNGAVYVVFAYVYQRQSEYATRWFSYSIVVALIVQLGILHGGEDAFRAIGSFNNPNQLGYWGLLLIATYGAIRHDRELSLVDLCVVGLALWICMQSLSRAAITPAVAISLVIVLFHPARNYVRATLACGIAAMLVVLSLQGGMTDHISEAQTVAGVEKRFTKTDKQQRSELEVRGYDRIWKFPEHLFVGAGEGMERRFTPGGPFELHSSFGVMLFCYGVVGLFLILFLLYQSLRSTPLLVKAYFLPVLLYGLTHHGLRFSYFWILLGIVAAIGSQYRTERSRLPSQSRSA